MKSIKSLVAITLLAFISFSFTNNVSKKKNIKINNSKIVWKGHKVTGSHEGTIGIKSGFLSFDGSNLQGGEVIIDMTSINVTDLEGEYKGKLEGHLKSDDFFGVENNPTASLVLNKVKSTGKNSYEVGGDLSIKGKTEPISFNVKINGNKASASLKIDRTKFGIRYGSPSFFNDLQDKAIYDEFDLIAELEF